MSFEIPDHVRKGWMAHGDDGFIKTLIAFVFHRNRGVLNQCEGGTLIFLLKCCQCCFEILRSFLFVHLVNLAPRL